MKLSKVPSEFLAEAGEIFDALSRDLMTLDSSRGKEVDPDLLNGIFRSAHSVNRGLPLPERER